MKVSWSWLNDYVSLPKQPDAAVDRLTMSGLNHEETVPWADDFCVDLEVTSNRPDCLGHIGVARELSVLLDEPLGLPDPQPKESAARAADVVQVEVAAAALCSRYTARVIRGVKVGPSPAWLADRLQAIGVAPVNNVVDVTNYVMMECGQPLHAFDLARVRGGKIVVRDATAGETFEAINHQGYELQPGMCVIADAEGSVALGGVMGGVDSEVSEDTVDLLIEAADFAPRAIRKTSHTLKLRSEASYRFERGVDPEGIDWASRRCCELILKVAGGELLAGVVDAGQPPAARPSVRLRFDQVTRLVGVAVPPEECRRIVEKLGVVIERADDESLEGVAPSWRADLTREIDLIEEVARIHGYDQIPEHAAIPIHASHRSDREVALERLRSLLCGSGFDEAMTPSLIPESWVERFTPWTERPALSTQQPMEGVLDRASQNAGAVAFLRRSLLPSLVEARRINEFRGNEEIELFELAKVYLPTDQSLPFEPLMLGLVSQRDYRAVKGVVEGLLEHLHVTADLEVSHSELAWLDVSRQSRICLAGETLGWIGELSSAVAKDLQVRPVCCVAELDLEVLFKHVNLVPQQRKLSPFPAVDRDFNFIVDESVLWGDMEATVRGACGELLEQIEYRETFRDPEKDGAGKKRVLLSIRLRDLTQTLTGERVEDLSREVVERCRQSQQAELLG